MNDSNRTLRFSRSAREAYGHDIEFENEHIKRRENLMVVAIIAGVFFLGVLLGSSAHI